jgi:hypothetical protein
MPVQFNGTPHLPTPRAPAFALDVVDTDKEIELTPRTCSGKCLASKTSRYQRGRDGARQSIPFPGSNEPSRSVTRRAADKLRQFTLTRGIYDFFYGELC